MVDIQSKEVIDKISNELKVQPALMIPRSLMEKLQLVYNVNPSRVVNLVETATLAVTGGATIFTSSPDRDTFITAITWTLHADVSNDGTAASVSVVLPNGATVFPINIVKIALLEQVFEKTLVFNPPIKVLRNSIIRHSQAFTLGSGAISTTVFGYETDPQ